MKIHIVIPFLLLLLDGCRQPNNEKNRPGSAKPASIYDSPATALAKPANRKFIRSAEMKFRVKDLDETSRVIEKIIKKENGFLIYTHFSNTIENTTVVSVSRDSSIETIYYTIGNTITFRIPAVGFDSVLQQVAALTDFLDFRTVKAEDVSLQMISVNPATKHADPGNTENSHEWRDNTELSGFYLNDQISYSTVNLLIYQRQSLKRTMIANTANIKTYIPGFGTRIMDAFLDGWNRVEELALFIIRFWAIIGLLLVFYFFYRKYGRHIQALLTKKNNL